MRHEYTSLHDIKDICMIYEGSWPIKYWNFTEYKHMYLRFLSIEDDNSKDHMVINFEICDKDYPDRLQNICDWKRLIKHYEEQIEHILDAEIVVKDRKSGQRMKLYFTGSTNRPEGEKCVNFNLDYCDENYHKWKRDLCWVWLNANVRIRKFLKNFK